LKSSLTTLECNGLKAIAELKGLRGRLLAFLGERPFETEEGIEAVPTAGFLAEPAAQRI